MPRSPLSTKPFSARLMCLVSTAVSECDERAPGISLYHDSAATWYLGCSTKDAHAERSPWSLLTSRDGQPEPSEGGDAVVQQECDTRERMAHVLLLESVHT